MRGRGRVVVHLQQPRMHWGAYLKALQVSALLNALNINV